ncbi:MAG: hypothetical protein AAF492_30615, partial [Verrucomicrobiota bacterium]
PVCRALALIYSYFEPLWYRWMKNLVSEGCLPGSVIKLWLGDQVACGETGNVSPERLEAYRRHEGKVLSLLDHLDRGELIEVAELLEDDVRRFDHSSQVRSDIVRWSILTHTRAPVEYLLFDEDDHSSDAILEEEVITGILNDESASELADPWYSKASADHRSQLIDDITP